MPKKLAQLVKDVSGIGTGFEKQMSELSRISKQLPDHGRDVLRNAQDKLKHRIEELQKSGKKVDRIGDASYDSVAKKLLDEFDIHKMKLKTLLKDYWRTRSELDKIIKSTDAVLARTDAIIADKQNQWFSSGSVDAMKKTRTQLASSRAEMKKAVADLGKGLPEYGDIAVDVLLLGTKSMRVADLKERWDSPEIDQFIKDFHKRTAQEKKLTADFRKTVHDLDEIARRNSDV
jgi:hypothetical protein